MYSVESPSSMTLALQLYALNSAAEIAAAVVVVVVDLELHCSMSIE